MISNDIKKLINPELYKYIEANIFPIYSSERVDEGHKLPHIESVINRSMKFAMDYNRQHEDQLDYNMVFTIASYHDVGLSVADRSIHEKMSAEMMSQDKNLLQFFNENQIDTMVTAVRDHRASNKQEPRSIYGKMVSQADRDNDLMEIIRRSYVYRKDKEPYKSDRYSLIADIKDHIVSKYGEDGYCHNKVWFEDEQLTKFFEEVAEISKNKGKFDACINYVIDKNTSSRNLPRKQAMQRNGCGISGYTGSVKIYEFE